MSRRKSLKIDKEIQAEPNPYEILEVSDTATDREIRKAYLQKVKAAPPERNPEEFKKIRKAYGILKDINNRKKLDLSLFRAVSDIEVDTHVSDDFNELFTDRIFQLLLVSSDLYIKDFSRFFTSIDDEIEALN
ncbi:MAG: DnaJ domain-containing protein [Spirochaetia bacterium]|jgi:curved DNA-binding protein CbpA|nr:DnaJ domain-containing protein [Spirochaetia bacterium]